LAWDAQKSGAMSIHQIESCSGQKFHFGLNRAAIPDDQFPGGNITVALTGVASGSLTTKRVAYMAFRYRIERSRGIKEAQQQLATLREKWPLAFPIRDQDVRPLAIGVARDIAAAMSWTLAYTLGVLASWKMTPVYCQAILRYDERIAIDGATAGAVDAEAKDMAAKRLAELATQKLTKKATTLAPPIVASPDPVPPQPTETPGQLRALVRASLLRRSA
jgi:hypothetical protein